MEDDKEATTHLPTCQIDDTNIPHILKFPPQCQLKSPPPLSLSPRHNPSPAPNYPPTLNTHIYHLKQTITLIELLLVT